MFAHLRDLLHSACRNATSYTRTLGHDDAFALLLAAHHPQLHLLGVSTVHGNASVEATTANAIAILQAIGKCDVPVFRGAENPLKRRRQGAEQFHGTSSTHVQTRLLSFFGPR